MDAEEAAYFHEEIGNRELLQIYYERLYPYRLMYKWLSYEDEVDKYFQKREFSFTLNEIYMRYLSFRSFEEMRREIQRICPDKIDLGALYLWPPCDPRVRREVVARELTFDIDLCDYDEVRSCCQGNNICAQCWKFMAIACKIIHRALLEDFGYEHQLWVFSGRRGIHCWVCDDEARQLDFEMRETIADYLQVLPLVLSHKKVRLEDATIHTSVRRAIEIIEQYFVSVCLEDQDMLGTPSQIEKVLALFPDEARMSDLDKEMRVLTTSRERWDAIVKHIKDLQMHGELNAPHKYVLQEVQLQYAYPRMDISVTVTLNHLLKAPFSIHPSTEILCAPFNPDLVDEFKPWQLPTLSQLYSEITKLDQDGMSDIASCKDYLNTSMCTSILVFKTFLDKMKATCRPMCELAA